MVVVVIKISMTLVDVVDRDLFGSKVVRNGDKQRHYQLGHFQVLHSVQLINYPPPNYVWSRLHSSTCGMRCSTSGYIATSDLDALDTRQRTRYVA